MKKILFTTVALGLALTFGAAHAGEKPASAGYDHATVKAVEMKKEASEKADAAKANAPTTTEDAAKNAEAPGTAVKEIAQETKCDAAERIKGDCAKKKAEEAKNKKPGQSDAKTEAQDNMKEMKSEMKEMKSEMKEMKKETEKMKH